MFTKNSDERVTNLCSNIKTSNLQVLYERPDIMWYKRSGITVKETALRDISINCKEFYSKNMKSLFSSDWIYSYETYESLI